METLDSLAEQCINIVLKIIYLYEDSKLSKEEFHANTKIKISFLTKYLNQIEDPKIRKQSKRVIDYCEKLSEKDTFSIS